MPIIEMQHDQDPKTTILNTIGDISTLEIFNNQILVAVYLRPQKTKSGIILTDNIRNEDKYQSKIGLIVKKGPEAFVDETGSWFKGLNIDVGDWVIFRPSDAWQMDVNGVTCRILEDTLVKGRVVNPDMIY